MKKLSTLATLVILIMALGATLAVAKNGESNPAVNKNRCADVGGEFSDNGQRGKDRINYCEIGEVAVEINEGVPASHPQQDWTVDVEVINGTMTVHSFQPASGFHSETQEFTGEENVVACYNHQGHQVDHDGGDNPNCQPA